jgi:drug/metabolite transporter (DMT)-like permease
MSKELTTLAAIMAMIGNVSFSLRSILRRNFTQEFKQRTNLDPANDHAVTTIYSALLTLPFCFLLEKPENLYNSFKGLSENIQNTFLLNLFICGMCFYIYNELQNKVLGSLGPVPTAVGNTLKRVAIFAALYFFTEGETFPLPKIVGCVIAIAGCLLFAIFDAKKI